MQMNHTYTIVALERAPLALSNPLNRMLKINNRGHIVGPWRMPASKGVFFYDGLRIHLLDVCGGADSSVIAINDSDHIAGMTWLDARLSGKVAFMFDGVDCHTFDPLGRYDSFAQAINNHDRVLIQCNGNRAFYTEAGQVVPLAAPAHYRIQAHGMNDAGNIVGMCQDTRFPRPPAQAFVSDGQTMHSLGTLDFGSGRRMGSTALAINNQGQIVGLSTDYSGTRHAFLYDGARMHDLGTLAGWNSQALAINNHGDAVGYANHPDIARKEYRALLWRDRTLIDLNDLVVGAEWELLTAVDINDAGQIVGWGEVAGQLCGFLLTPDAAAHGDALPGRGDHPQGGG